MIPHVKRHAITGLLFAMLLFQTGVTFAKAPAASPAALPNFHTVVANIYRGGAPTHAGMPYCRNSRMHLLTFWMRFIRALVFRGCWLVFISLKSWVS